AVGGAVGLGGRRPEVRSAGRLDWLDTVLEISPSASDCQQRSFSDSAPVASAKPCLAGFSSQSATSESGLGTLLWPSHPAGGDFCGRLALPRDLLSGRRLAEAGGHARFRQARPGLSRSRPSQAGV